MLKVIGENGSNGGEVLEGKVNPYPILFFGIINVSFAAILIRPLTAPPLIIAFYRLFYTVLILLLILPFRYKKEFTSIGWRSVFLSLLAGTFLGLHFFTWISSLQYTSVSSSVLLVTTHPIMVFVISVLFFQEKLSMKKLLGILMAVIGSIIIGVEGLNVYGGALKGDLLALIGAVMMAGYILVGSRVRPVLSLIPYLLFTYSFACIQLFLLSLYYHGFQRGYSLDQHLLLFLLAFGPTLLGHSSFNWALRYIPSTAVSVSILGEPIGATILAYYFFLEIPSPLALGGGVLLLIGIYRTLRG